MVQKSGRMNRRRRPRGAWARSLTERFQPLREFVCHFEWIHISLGILGNVAFVIGSIFFLWESLTTAGIWLFILGSLGMLMASIGSAIVQAESK